MKIENDTWKEKLIKESWRKLQDVEKKFKNKMENMETNYVNQLNEANNEAKKREELFLMSMKRKPAGYHDAATESNSEVIKFNSEVNILQNFIRRNFEWLIFINVCTLAASQYINQITFVFLVKKQEKYMIKKFSPVFCLFKFFFPLKSYHEWEKPVESV